MTDNIPSDMTKKGSSTQNRTRHKHHITNSRLACTCTFQLRQNSIWNWKSLCMITCQSI